LAEPLPQVRCGRVGLLDQVVHHAGSDHVVGRARAVEERGDLTGVKDERRAVRSLLPCVHALGVLDRPLRQREPVCEPRYAAPVRHVFRV
jgi:hypothetical protein